MKTLLFLNVMGLLLIPSLAHAQISFEKSDTCASNISNCRGVTEELVAMVKKDNWRCDSVSHVRQLIWDRGFAIHCNQYAYEYIVKDIGGHWTVIVKD
jgi:hypothetical protein